MDEDLGLFGDEAVRNAKPVVPLFHIEPATHASGRFVAEEELTKFGRQPRIIHLSKAEYHRRQTVVVLLTFLQAALASFVVVFVPMMLLRAENSLSGRYAELMDYFWYVVPVGTLFLSPIGVWILLPISYGSSGSGCFYAVTQRGVRTDLILSEGRNLRGYGCELLRFPPFVLSRTCTATLHDLDQFYIRFLIRFAVAPARVWDFQEADQNNQVSITLARVIGTSLKRWSSAPGEGPQDMAAVLAAYDEAQDIVARSAEEAAAKLGIAIEEVVIIAIEPVR
jgi:hypothetical protein